MPALTVTDRDRRTIRIGAVAVSIYLILFFGWHTWKRVEARRSDYQRLYKEAVSLRRQLQPYENRVLLVEKLRKSFRLDLSKLSPASLVGQTSAAIQKAAQAGGVQLGPIRESPGNASAKELASMQLECTGPVPAMMLLLHRLENLGYPLIVDAVQISPDPTKPGMIKLNLTIVILDFEQWKTEEPRNV